MMRQQPRFRKKKQVSLKLTKIFISITRSIYTKLLRLGHAKYLLEYCLRQQLFANKDKCKLCMKMRQCSIFKTTNTMTMNEPILESIFNVLQSL